MSNRHTTAFTTDPVYRARNEIRNRLERLQDEARVTANALGAFDADSADARMWRLVEQMSGGMVESLSATNQVERQNKTAAASAARLQGPSNVGHLLQPQEGN